VKVLLLNINRWKVHNRGHELFKLQVELQHDTKIYGVNYDPGRLHGNHIQGIIDGLEFQPDIIFTYTAKWSEWVEGLRECKIPKVHRTPDYMPIIHNGKRLLWIARHEDPFIRERKIDLVLCPNRIQVLEMTLEHPLTRVERLPFSVDTTIYRSRGQEREIDVSAIMTVVPRYYPTRGQIVEEVGKMPNSFAVGGYGKHKDRVFFEDYIDTLSRTKIAVNSTLLKRTNHKLLNPRFLEIPACGAMLLTEPADDMADLGFIPGENCETFETIDEMNGKLNWYLQNDDERVRVARLGTRLVRKYHSNALRVQQMTKMIERIL